MVFSSKMKTIMARVRQDIWHLSTSSYNLMTILSKFNLWVQPNESLLCHLNLDYNFGPLITTWALISEFDLLEDNLEGVEW